MMVEYQAHGGHNSAGQRVEYREYLRQGDSPAERRVAVYVTNRKVADGWASDGKTYELFTRWLAGTATAEDGACMFHGRPYPEHDWYYGAQCRRCGTWKLMKPGGEWGPNPFCPGPKHTEDCPEGCEEVNGRA
jgi:hypothetical protein